MNKLSKILLYLANNSGVDFHHPVGSYYETSDTSFDPNVTWGGTWVLEDAGKVHVSAGTGYVAGSTGGASTKSYTPTGSIGATKLTDQQIAHGHDFTRPTVPAHSHGFTQPNGPSHSHGAGSGRAFVTQISGQGIGEKSCNLPGSDFHVPSITGSDNWYGAANTASAGTGKCTGGAVHERSAFSTTGGGVGNLYGASTARTAHGHTWTGTASSIDVMQPYIVVNRWHRTA